MATQTGGIIQNKGQRRKAKAKGKGERQRRKAKAKAKAAALKRGATFKPSPGMATYPGRQFSFRTAGGPEEGGRVFAKGLPSWRAGWRGRRKSTIIVQNNRGVGRHRREGRILC